MELPDPPEDKRKLLDSFDGMAGLRHGLRYCAERDREWAGIPMPLSGERLVIEPTYPRAEALSKIGAPAGEPLPAGYKWRNSFWSHHKRSLIMVWEQEGKIVWGLDPGVHHFEYDMRTLGCQEAWSIESEHYALKTLGGLVSHRQFKQYLMTGMFLETSKRSGVTYCFRKLRPTVALRHNALKDRIEILCCLCLHPIAFYSGSWAGAMTPTDDVLAHLMLMRGDEVMFWRRSNQHEAHRPEAGL